jgi:hypothetical protein
VEVYSNADRLEIRRRVFHCLYCLDRYAPHPESSISSMIEPDC